MTLNSMEVIPVIMIIGGGVLYHVCQKATPAGVDPFLALGISFGLASLGCLGLFVGKQGLATPQLHRVNWTSMALAVALMLIESGYLIGYRAGLKLNLTSFACNNSIALVLLGVGTFFYGERFTFRTGPGMVLCVAGLLLLRWG
jgi:drug/metabolite transporter (DMT)-like permease